MTSFKQTICRTTLIVFLIVGSFMTSIHAKDEGGFGFSLSIQLTNVSSTMSSDIQSIYEDTLIQFYTKSFINKFHKFKVTLEDQFFEEEESSSSSRLLLRRNDRSLQTTRTTHAAKPLYTLLMVEGRSVVPLDPEKFDQFYAVLKDNYAFIIYLLKAADSTTYFQSLTLMEVFGSRYPKKIIVAN